MIQAINSEKARGSPISPKKSNIFINNGDRNNTYNECRYKDYENKFTKILTILLKTTKVRWAINTILHMVQQVTKTIDILTYSNRKKQWMQMKVLYGDCENKFTKILKFLLMKTKVRQTMNEWCSTLFTKLPKSIT